MPNLIGKGDRLRLTCTARPEGGPAVAELYMAKQPDDCPAHGPMRPDTRSGSDHIIGQWVCHGYDGEGCLVTPPVPPDWQHIGHADDQQISWQPFQGLDITTQAGTSG